jgi:hypothetical protein
MMGAHKLMLLGSVALSLALLTWIGTYPAADAGVEPPLITANLRPIKAWAEVEPAPVEAKPACPEWTICPSPPKPAWEGLNMETESEA